MLITKKVMVELRGSNIKYYESLGYEIPRHIDKRGRLTIPKGTKILVKVCDLPKSSIAIVEYKYDCEHNNEIITGRYCDYIKCVKDDGKIYCKSCSMKLFGKKKRLKTMLKDGKSFEQWCINNNRLDLLARWDEEKNGCKPSEVLYGTRDEYWFKCDKHPEHHNEKKSLNAITSGYGSDSCIQCNSIMQYCIDNNCVNELNLKKNYDLGLNLWSISYGSHSIKIWFLCDNEETPYHNDFDGYEMTPNDFINNHRCPYCSNLKVHPKDSLAQYVIDNFGLDFLNKIWNWDKNNKLGIDPWKIKPNSGIEVWWNCPDGKHEPFLRDCSHSKHCDFRCHKCYYDNIKGENHPKWNPDLTDEDRQIGRKYPGYTRFRKDVMKRDCYTCQITGKRGGNLVVHHLNSYNWDKENRTNPDNGITLCEEIHRLFHSIYGYKNCTEEQFNDFLIKIELGEIDISNI